MTNSQVEDLYGASLHAKWHSLHFEALRNDRGIWLQLTETRPNGRRQAIVTDSEFLDSFERELLKAVSAVRAAQQISVESSPAPDRAHSASAVRPRSYDEWTDEEDRALGFLYRIGSSVSDIAQSLQRERGAVRSRLGKVGSIGGGR